MGKLKCIEWRCEVESQDYLREIYVRFYYAQPYAQRLQTLIHFNLTVFVEF